MNRRRGIEETPLASQLPMARSAKQGEEEEEEEEEEEVVVEER
jgi:hypothetical protein